MPSVKAMVPSVEFRMVSEFCRIISLVKPPPPVLAILMAVVTALSSALLM